MGAIRVRVKLVNGEDETLMRRGQLAPDQVRNCEVDALVDRGAVRSTIPHEVAQRLGVAERGQITAQYADGRRETVGVSEGVLFEVLHRETLEEALIPGDEVLIGQTILEKLDLLADCANGRLLPAHGDQEISMVK
jgi:predicted aspartyl protease